MSGLVVQGLRARHRYGPDVVRGVSLGARRGRVTALLGPNGSGKSTLIQAILGLVPCSGSVTLDGAAVHDLTRAERARRLAYVPQRTQLLARLDVESVVTQGRFAHLRGPAGPGAADRDVVAAAMADAGVTHLARRPFPELSGGEQARVVLARALATGATALLLDEPTASLDVRQVLGLHAVLRRLAERGCCVLIVLHDLGEVRRHADDAVLLTQGRVHAAGSVGEVVAAGPVRDVYGVDLVERASLGWRLPEGGP